MTVGIISVIPIEMAATIAGSRGVRSASAIPAGGHALAIGIAEKRLIANLYAWIFIIWDERFTTALWIEWNGNSGVIREMHRRVMKIDSFETEFLTILNNEGGTAVVVTKVDNTHHRIPVDGGIGYDDETGSRYP